MTPTQIYKIFWLQHTTCQPSKFYKKNTYKVTGEYGNVLEVERWEFIESTPETLREDVIKWLEEKDNEIEVFCVTQKWNKIKLLTEENL